MKLKEASPDLLQDRTERASAKLARIARGDTVHGGARALVLAKRLNAQHSQVEADTIVGDIYAASNYTVCGHGAFECPECGSVHYGEDAARACCAEQPEYFSPDDFSTEQPDD